MKSITSLLLLFPILIYVVLLLINNHLLIIKEEVNIFWITSLDLPIISIISLFFILYIFIIYFSGKFVSFFTNSKIKTLKEDNLKIKAELVNKIPEIEKVIGQKFENILEDFKDISNKNLELHKNQTKQVLENLEFEIKNIKEKLDR